MADEKSEKTGNAEEQAPPADTLIKTGKDAKVELSEDDLAKVTGGVKTISWSQG